MDETALISRKAGRIQSDGKRKVPDKRRGVLKLWMVRDTWLCWGAARARRDRSRSVETRNRAHECCMRVVPVLSTLNERQVGAVAHIGWHEDTAGAALELVRHKRAGEKDQWRGGERERGEEGRVGGEKDRRRREGGVAGV